MVHHISIFYHQQIWATKYHVGQQISNKNSDKIGKWATNKRKNLL
jgi:hypothetical protein